MTVQFTRIYNQEHQYNQGFADVNTAFTGNVLFVNVNTDLAIDRLQENIGVVYVYSGERGTAYTLTKEQTILQIPIPEVTRLRFLPLGDSYTNYTLIIEYSTVGAVIDSPNSSAIPELITGLPIKVNVLEGIVVQHSSRLDTIEEDLEGMVTPNWVGLADKPSAFPPSAHTHSISDINGLSLALNDLGNADTQNALEIDQLTGRVNTLESNPVASSSNFIPLSTNTQLESNKSYLASANNLACSLPNNPSVGDFVTLLNGNFSSFRINHGGISQSILNNATLTTSGSTSNGIILKPYGTITLVFIGTGLWVSTNRIRTINNWLNPTQEASSSQKTYIPTALESYSYFQGTYPPSRLNDGDTSNAGVIKISGGTFGLLGIVCTFPDLTKVEQFRIFYGSNAPNLVDIYLGNSINAPNLIYSGLPPSNVLQSLETSSSSNTYLFCFRSSSDTIIVNELQIFGKGFTGGEISVI